MLALFVWPCGDPAWGPGAAENLKEANKTRQISFQPEQLPGLAQVIIVPGEVV